MDITEILNLQDFFLKTLLILILVAFGPTVLTFLDCKAFQNRRLIGAIKLTLSIDGQQLF